jgi:hypothetical protein
VVRQVAPEVQLPVQAQQTEAVVEAGAVLQQGRLEQAVLV